ncbi:MAG: DUF3300 domain-containing protein [Woeseia sp.]
MKTESMHKRPAHELFWLLPFFACALLASGSLPAQVPVDEAGNPIDALDETANATEAQGAKTADTASIEAAEAPLLTAEELETLVGPIALYPDKLLAIVLPASTYPLEIVQAARFLEQLEDDSGLKSDESWDDSVTALLNYPEVVQMMDKDIDWTWRLGEAVVSQQADVIAAVETFRDRAYAAGNLKTDERQTVSNNGGAIEIQPVSEEIIYVPYYEPERVVDYQPRQVYYYYPRPYPVYYYPYPVHHSFASGYFWGVTTAFNIGWATDHLHVFHHSYWGHPYYGRHYFGHYYRRPSINVYNTYYVDHNRHGSEHRHRDGDYWRPRDGGARPGHYRTRLERFREHPREHTVEGYRLPERNARRVASTNDRVGFRGDAGNRVERDNRANNNREGFAASRDNDNARDRVGTNPADRARQPDRAVADNATASDTIRFRARNRAAAAAQQERRRSSADAASRVPERTATTRLAERRDSNDDIRFRSRDRTAGNSAADRARPSISSSGSSRDADRTGITDNSGSRDRSAIRDRSIRTRTATPPAVRTAPSDSGFRSTPRRSEAVSRPQVSQQRAAPRMSTARPAPQPRASAPARTSSATPPPRESRAAPSRSSNDTAPHRRTREQ